MREPKGQSVLPFPAELDRRDEDSLTDRVTCSAPADFELVGNQDMSEKRRHLRSRLCEMEDVVNEQQLTFASKLRKYSTIVRPVRATRAWAPGGKYCLPVPY